MIRIIEKGTSHLSDLNNAADLFGGLGRANDDDLDVVSIHGERQSWLLWNKGCQQHLDFSSREV